MLEYRSDSPDTTLKWAQSLGEKLKGNELILLAGEMGAGKTLFCKGLAQGMGIDADDVVSPTFTLMNCYEGTAFRLYHLDLYRIADFPGGIGFCPEIDDNLGIGVVVVEWAQYLAPSYWRLPETMGIHIDMLADETRLFSLGRVQAESV